MEPHRNLVNRIRYRLRRERGLFISRDRMSMSGDDARDRWRIYDANDRLMCQKPLTFDQVVAVAEGRLDLAQWEPPRNPVISKPDPEPVHEAKVIGHGRAANGLPTHGPDGLRIRPEPEHEPHDWTVEEIWAIYGRPDHIGPNGEKLYDPEERHQEELAAWKAEHEPEQTKKSRWRRSRQAV